MLDLSDKDESLAKLFLAASSHQWHLLPGRCLLSARVKGCMPNCSVPHIQSMLDMQSLGELATNMVALSRISEAASDMLLCRLQQCFCFAVNPIVNIHCS